MTAFIDELATCDWAALTPSIRGAAF